MSRRNIRAADEEPPIAVRDGLKTTYGSEIEILHEGVVGRFRCSAKKPLLYCGARLIFETDFEVRVVR